METKGELDLEGLQHWQKEILRYKDMDKMMDCVYSGGDYAITDSQAHMLETILSKDFFYIGDEGDRGILERVYESGKYIEEEKEVLNRAREEYLKGNNWIKGNS